MTPRQLHIASPLLAGPDVLHVQTELAHLGFAPGMRDGRYGPATAAAVRSFQRQHHLHVDGIVGTATARALTAAAKHHGSVAPTTRRDASSAGARALAEAIKHLGVRESPPGSNRTPYGKWFGVDGVPWCNVFVSYCFKAGAGIIIAHGFHGAGVYPNGCTYVPTTEAWLRATGHWAGHTSPLPGDLAIYNWDGGVPDHIGIVERYLGGGKFTAIEGNTAIGNDSNGGEVMRRERYVSQVNGFGRVR